MTQATDAQTLVMTALTAKVAAVLDKVQNTTFEDTAAVNANTAAAQAAIDKLTTIVPDAPVAA